MVHETLFIALLAVLALIALMFTSASLYRKADYIANMGRPDIVRIKRDADVAAAEAERDTAIRRAEAMREAAVAKGNGRPGACARSPWRKPKRNAISKSKKRNISKA
jgi:uncharacterized membrane protein YqiK